MEVQETGKEAVASAESIIQVKSLYWIVPEASDSNNSKKGSSHLDGTKERRAWASVVAASCYMCTYIHRIKKSILRVSPFS